MLTLDRTLARQMSTVRMVAQMWVPDSKADRMRTWVADLEPGAGVA